MDRTENGFEFQIALLEPRRQQSNRLKFLKLHDFQPRILYSSKQFKYKDIIRAQKFTYYAHLLKNIYWSVRYTKTKEYTKTQRIR